MAGRLIKRFMSLKTPLYDTYLLKSTRFETKNQFWLPKMFENVPIMDEYFLCKNKAVIYDAGYMGQVIIKGGHRLEFLNWISTSVYNEIFYSNSYHTLVLNEDGNIIDRVLVCSFENEFRIFMFNKNTEKYIYECKEKFWKHKRKAVNLEIPDESYIYMQGPKTKFYLSEALRQIKIGSFSAKRCFLTKFKAFNDENSLVSWLDFTGQSGVLISMKKEKIPMLVDLFQKISYDDVQIAGLLSQRLLRTEVGFWNEEELIAPLNPIEARWMISDEKLKNTDWIGGQAIKQLKLKKDHDKLVKFELDGDHRLTGSNIMDGYTRHAGIILSMSYNKFTRKSTGFCKLKHKYLSNQKELYAGNRNLINIIK